MQTINGIQFYEMLMSGAGAMEEDRDWINDLNVFPVPDGDTGSNMTTTVLAVRQITADASIAQTSAMAARQMMRSARGNSGVILSLFFRGMARSFVDCSEADAKQITAAFREGAKQAASAVDKPVEGTILTVMRDCVNEESTDAAPESDIANLFQSILRRAEEILAQTPEMLPALKRAKVVDSGGAGFVSILAGMTAALTGTARTAAEPRHDTAQIPASPAPTDEADTDEEIRFGFCTECLLDLDGEIPPEKLAAIRETLQGMGDSMVLTADEDLFKVHIHTNEPMRVLEMLLPLGTLRTSKIENMRLQHDGVVKKAAGKAAAAPDNASADGTKSSLLEGVKNTLREVKEPIEGAVNKLLRTVLPAEEEEPHRPYAVIAAADGDGFTDLFREMGACAVVPINPSPADFLRAIRENPADTTILLPNNKNAILAGQSRRRKWHGTQRSQPRSRSCPPAICRRASPPSLPSMRAAHPRKISKICVPPSRRSLPSPSRSPHGTRKPTAYRCAHGTSSVLQTAPYACPPRACPKPSPHSCPPSPTARPSRSTTARG